MLKFMIKLVILWALFKVAIGFTLKRGSLFSSMNTQLMTESGRPTEVLFLVDNLDGSEYVKYDWTKMTSLALLPNQLDHTLIQTSHDQGTRVLLRITSFNHSQSDITNKTVRSAWVADTVKQCYEQQLDGVFLDFTVETETQQDGFVALVQETKFVFRIEDIDLVTLALQPNFSLNTTKQLSVWADWMVVRPPSLGIDSSFGPHPLASITELDQQLKSLISTGVNPSQIVQLYPWKGASFACNSTFVGLSTTKRIFSRKSASSSCASYTNSLIPYNHVNNIISQFNASPKLDRDSDSLVFHYQSSESEQVTVWFDDSHTLSEKYRLAEKYGLKGVALWSSSDLDYDSNSKQAELTKQMWRVVPSPDKAHRSLEI